MLILEYVGYHTTKGISSGTEDVFLQTMDMVSHVGLFRQVFGTMTVLSLCAIRFYLKSFYWFIVQVDDEYEYGYCTRWIMNK